MRRTLAGCILLLATAALTAPASRLSDADPPPPLPDAGVHVALSAEDAEVVRDLELLEHLDEARDLDLLHTL